MGIDYYEAYNCAAEWHDKQAIACLRIVNDDKRINEEIRERARVAATHHLASAAGLRQAAISNNRKG